MNGLVTLLLATLLVIHFTECRNTKDTEFPKPSKSPSRTRQERQHNRRLSNSNDKLNDLEDTEKDCHKKALRWCGRSFMKVFKLLPFLSGKQAFDAKCVLREAFFSCLDQLRKKPCKRSRKSSKDDNFRKKLTERLWSTRVCVLGLKDDNLDK